MKTKTEWVKVTKNDPCKICGKPDWCTYCEDGACCMRIHSSLPMKNGGWFFKDYFNRIIIPVQKTAQVPREEIDATALWELWLEQSAPKSLILFAEKLGVEPMSLYALGCVWAYPHFAWGFPMRNELREIIGIRLRNEVGHKWAVKGSKSGLFIPNELNTKETLFITEGPTDCASALCMGFQAIGRPSCLGLEEMIQSFLSINKIKRCVIVADNDEPGIRGAEKLQSEINISSCVLILPSNDMREFLNNNGTKKDVENIIKNLVWSKK